MSPPEPVAPEQVRDSGDPAVLLAVLAHELKTPLTVLLGALRRLTTSGSEDSRDALLAAALRHAERLERLVGQATDHQALTAATLSLHVVPLDLAELTADAVAEVRRQHVGISLELRAPDVPLVVAADRRRVLQVFAELLDNAARAAPAHPISIDLSAQGAMARIDVADAGPGIAPEDRHRVFEPFVQLDGTRAPLEERSARGLGFGLALCRGLVGAMGGSIEISDSGPTGTTVRFTLPLAASSAAGLPDSRPAPAGTTP